MQALSTNTQVILLLTAPLIARGGASSTELLSPGEYKRLARRLRDIQRQPSDLVSLEAAEILRACQPVIDGDRLQRLLARGFLLSQVVERWQSRAIWVVSRADPQYPRRLKSRMREDAPAVLYGCGDISLLDTGGLAVVGSRQVSDELIEYTRSIGELAAHAGRTVVSGGARGVDRAAMQGSWGSGGKVIGVLAEHLEKTVMNREERNYLLDGSLVLVSAYDPCAGFNVGHAMQRNKVIYAFADAALVVNSDFNKGGTWAGAAEQLEKLKFTPVFIRSTGEPSVGLDGLRKKGALPWPNPQDLDSFRAVFNLAMPVSTTSPPVGYELTLNDEQTSSDSKPTMLELTDVSAVDESLALVDISSDPQVTGSRLNEPESVPHEVLATLGGVEASPQPKPTPAEVLFAAVSLSIQQLLRTPMKEAEVAAALDVSNGQAKAWLQRLVEEGVLEKQKKPIGYIVKQKRLFV